MADMLVDTGVLVDHLRGAVELERPPSGSISCSVITRTELLAGPQGQEAAVRQLLASLDEIPVSSEIAGAAGLIRRESGIATPDALIAATALSAGLELKSRNRKHFERVAGLRLA